MTAGCGVCSDPRDSLPGSGHKWMNLEWILKIELTIFSQRLAVWKGREGRDKNDFMVLA